MAIRKGSLVTLNEPAVRERAPHLVSLIGNRWKVDNVTGGKGRYRVHVGTVTLPLDFLLAVPQKKGKSATPKPATR